MANIKYLNHLKQLNLSVIIDKILHVCHVGTMYYRVYSTAQEFDLKTIWVIPLLACRCNVLQYIDVE